MVENAIYLLDDEPDLLELLADVVELAGLQARSFTRASMLFEQTQSFGEGSILVLDLNMPEVDGIEVMRRLAQIEQPPALILISGHDVGVLHAAEKLGQAHNLEILASMNKPVPLDKFQRLLKQHVPGSGQSNKRAPEEYAPTPNELHRAIIHSHLILYYQPQIEIATGKLVGVEALVRWQHPEQGMLFPGKFISMAEQNGLMGELTHWVIGEAVRQEQIWQEAGNPVPISVNISAENITSLTLPEQLAELLAENRLDPTRLTLEVTESMLMGELVTSLDILTRLRLKGIGLSVDDFGTGYSSLSQLHRAPFNELKIDQSFVAKMAQDSEAQAIVKTCIMLGHELSMRVVAEGIENEHTWGLLADLGCDIGQGYHIAKPMPGDALQEWINAKGVGVY